MISDLCLPQGAQACRLPGKLQAPRRRHRCEAGSRPFSHRVHAQHSGTLGMRWEQGKWQQNIPQVQHCIKSVNTLNVLKHVTPWAAPVMCSPPSACLMDIRLFQ